MTFQPVLPPVMLAVVSAMLIGLRLISMRQLHASGGAKWATVWRWCGFTLAVLLVLIAAWRPGLARNGQEATAAGPSGQNINLFLVVDRSPDSGIDDYDGKPRIEGIRADIGSLIEKYPHARFAMIEFASRASLDWPLSEDVWSLEPTVARLSSYAATAEEGDAAAAANILRYQLIAAGQQYRDSANLVFYFGSGASGSHAPQDEFEPVAGTVDGGAVFGYGDTPAYDEQRLRTIAEQLGVSYVHRQNGQPPPEAQTNPVAIQALGASSTVPGGVQRTELYWFFTMLASVLMLFELFVTIRDFRRMRVARRNVEV